MIDEVALPILTRLLDAPLGSAAVFAFLFWKIFNYYRNDMKDVVKANTEALTRMSRVVEEHSDVIIKRENDIEKEMEEKAKERGFKAHGE